MSAYSTLPGHDLMRTGEFRRPVSRSLRHISYRSSGLNRLGSIEEGQECADSSVAERLGLRRRCRAAPCFSPKAWVDDVGPHPCFSPKAWVTACEVANAGRRQFKDHPVVIRVFLTAVRRRSNRVGPRTGQQRRTVTGDLGTMVRTGRSGRGHPPSRAVLVAQSDLRIDELCRSRMPKSTRSSATFSR